MFRGNWQPQSADGWIFQSLTQILLRFGAIACNSNGWACANGGLVITMDKYTNRRDSHDIATALGEKWSGTSEKNRGIITMLINNGHLPLENASSRSTCLAFQADYHGGTRWICALCLAILKYMNLCVGRYIPYQYPSNYIIPYMYLFQSIHKKNTSLHSW